ncbi:L-histidine N(alpha)-methyltransferase [Methylocella tundrae]|uniref:Histidine N-alpha-methyltransferase n=1 Tax=Methylocella tundrae TaxID=227605 RepID=A0A4U8Z430_METTU|nr:L-histidine N(alpha)-methyltransferase [Methylocella tundrae]WPP04011.1 L-histidine N(alpha)-methyltransferase [Methylocella tundrae]VFU10237.1 Histidine N-alpha-methyltransferase [Methylocella tundrae]
MSQIAEKQTPDAPGSAKDPAARVILAGLSQSRKTLPCFLFYDIRGSELFEEITRLPEYYPTRTEAAIIEAAAKDIALHTPPGSVLVEFGSGSSRKTEILLSALPSLSAYVPIDVSRSALDEASSRLAVRFPSLRVLPTLGDFAEPLSLPQALSKRPRLGFFPGSTIGNFAPADACDLLSHMAENLGPSGRLVIGVDLRKDLSILLPAYNDAAGVTADFNLNILVRLNREMGADFNVDDFAHRAVFNREESRIEMHLVSLKAQSVELLGHSFAFAEGESIHTENSYKYSIPLFKELARRAGWFPREVWTDPKSLFSLHELTIAH